MSTDIRFPQGPFVDLGTGMVTIEWQQWLQSPEFITVVIGTMLDVASGGTGLDSGTPGGVLAFTASDTLESSAALGENRIVLGGGTDVPSTPLGLGTTTTLLHGNAAGAPTWGTVSLTADVSGTLPIASGGTNSAVALSGTTIMIASGGAIVQGTAGTATTVLHGNSGGAPTYGAVVLTADVSGVLPAANGGTGTTGAWAPYVPTRTGWTDVGAPTVTANYCQLANVVYFEIRVVPSTTVATTAGTSYVTLPVTAGGLSGDASMMNLTTLVGIGNCVIDVANSRCYVPTQVATGNTLTIAGWYRT